MGKRVIVHTVLFRSNHKEGAGDGVSFLNHMAIWQKIWYNKMRWKKTQHEKMKKEW